MGRTAGLTLIELMMVVVIVGILAAIAEPKLAATLRQSQEARTKINLASLRTGIALYYTDREGLAPFDDLDCLIPKYLPKIPSKFTPSYHPEGNTVSAGGSGAMGRSTGDWFYVNDLTDSAFGHVVVNCIHGDLKGRTWTSY